MSEHVIVDKQEAMTPSDATAAEPVSSRLGIGIGQQHWLIELAQAGEVLPLPESIANVPGAKPWFRGLANLRGALHGVIDLAHFQGLAPLERGRDISLLAFSTRLPVNGAILVSRMLGLQNISRMTPIEDGNPTQWAGEKWRDDNGVVWQALYLDRLCRDDAFLSITR